MELTVFSSQNFPKKATPKEPWVTFYKSGLIIFNAGAAKLIGLQAGQRISLAQDPDRPADWYFFKDDRHGYVVRPSHDGCANQLFNHSELVRTFLDALNLSVTDNHRFQLVDTPVKLTGPKDKYWKINIS